MTDQTKNINEKYLELQLLDQQLKQINQQITNLDNQLIELQRLNDNLDDIKKTKKNTEILVSIGGGIFTKAELKEHDKVLMNVGANTVVEKDIPSSKGIVTRQIDQIKNIIKQLEQEFGIIAMNVQIVQEDLQKLASEIKEKRQ